MEPGTPIGKYVVKRKLAEGGMAEIFLASARGAEGFEKEVVIKRIRSFMSNDPEFVAMFKAEALTASRLNHANIVQVHEFEKHEDSFYIAMEYVRGHSLWDVRKRCREQMVAIPPAMAAQIGLDVARALHYAHQLKDKGRLVGLVHRDVTPHNVLLSWEGAVKLTDFGIAKAGNKLTSPGMLKGKFAYMSPEQARGEEVDARTDVFALGVVLWEMLTGGRLFEGDSDIAVLRAVQQSVIAPPGRLNSDVPPELDAIVMRALERDVTKRFQTAQELERELGRFILQHAESIDDTDVGGFLRKIFTEEVGEDGRERTASGVSAPGIDVELSTGSGAGSGSGSGSGEKKREPTAVMPSASGAGRKPSWDEDADAKTFVKGVPQPIPMPVGLKPGAASSREDATSNIRKPSRPGDLPATALPVEEGRGEGASPASPDLERAPSPNETGSPANSASQQGARGAPSAGTAASGVPPSSSTRAGPAGSSASPVQPSNSMPAAASMQAGAAPSSSATPAAPTGAAPQSFAVGPPAPGDSTQAMAAQLRRGNSRRIGIVAAGVGLLAIAGVVAVVTRDRGGVQSPSSELPDAAAVVNVVTPPPVNPREVALLTQDAGAPDSGAPIPDAGAAPTPIAQHDAGTPVPPLAQEHPETHPAPSAVTAKGVLVVNATPWANISIDGRARGDVSGEKEFVLPVGKYVVRFEHPKRSTEKVVTIKEGRRSSLKFDVLGP